MSAGLFVDKFYEMDPEVDDLIRGGDLRNGMVVLLEDVLHRGDPERMGDNGYEAKRCREANQWCEVTDLNIRPRHDAGPLVTFVGLYPDGTKRTRTYDSSYAWIVRRFSMVAS